MSYADVTGHRAMAFDAIRNAAYAAALQRVITPDSVVLDLGCGLGVHGLLAARAGARKVFLVDPEIVVHSAVEIARHNGLGDRVQGFQGRIEEVTLPEKVDVIISVFTGNLLYSEDLLPSLFCARDRWLKPGGHLVPDHAELLFAPVSAPALHDEQVLGWLQRPFDLDYSPLRRYAANAMAGERRADVWPELLAAEQVFARADLMTASATNLDTTARFEIEREGLCHGLQGWIRIGFGAHSIATGPGKPPMHWTPRTLLFDEPLPVRAGASLSARVRRPEGGEWTWEAAVDGVRRRQSTFLAQPLAAARLASTAPTATPRLSRRGEAARCVLDQMAKGELTTAGLEALVRERFPDVAGSAREARNFVVAVLSRYAV